MSLTALIEAVLFWKAEPVSIAKLAEWLGRAPEEVRSALGDLERSLEGRGLTLITKDDEVLLGTAPAATELIERLGKEELSRDLGKAALETLTVILYRGPLARAEIDYIRGVNSSFILRNLQIRGLIERVINPDDARSFLYRPTFDLLQHLGLRRVEELPEYGTLVDQVNDFISQKNHDH